MNIKDVIAKQLGTKKPASKKQKYTSKKQKPAPQLPPRKGF